MESAFVDPAFPRALVARKVPIFPSYQMGPRADPISGSINTKCNRRGEATLEGHDGRNLPPIQQILRRAMQAARERDVVEHRLYKTLCHIKSRYRAIALHVIGILRRSDEIAAAHLAANIGGPG